MKAAAANTQSNWLDGNEQEVPGTPHRMTQDAQNAPVSSPTPATPTALHSEPTESVVSWNESIVKYFSWGRR